MLLAHAFGARYDLPIPLVLFVLGGALVVVLSFALVVHRQVEPNLGTGTAGVEQPAACPRGRGSRVAGVLAVLMTAVLAAIGIGGSQEVAENLLPTVFWLGVWIAVPLSCGLVGDWTAPVNPFVVLGRWGDRPGLRRLVLARPEPLPWPRRLGWWPATALYFLLACAELIVNATATQPSVIALGLVAYALLSWTAGLLFGPAWTARGEVFTVLFATWGRLGWFRFGAPGRRGFGGGLAAPVEPVASRIAFVLLLLISVTFDGLLATPAWSRLERSTLGPTLAGLGGLRLLTFLLLTAALAALFGLVAYGSARAGGDDARAAAALSGLLPSMLPIAYAYLLAHDLQYLLVNGQLLAPLVGNPIGSDSWPLRLPAPFNDDFDPDPALLPTAFYWYVGVAAIVAGHVLAVVVAHRHLARRARDPRWARRSEYPWLLAMVGYTMASLVLIAQPLTTESGPASAPVSAEGATE